MQILLTGFIGAIIGYITNWLAIKMIFRPHKAVYIGKFKVPFTPGLIPKEKSNIAKSVGKAIGKHLLDEDTIQSYLCGDKIKGVLKKWIGDKGAELKENKATVKVVLEDVMGDGYGKVISYGDKVTKEYLRKTIKDENNRDKIVAVIKDEIMKLLEQDVNTVTNSETYVKLQEYALGKIKEVKDSDKVNTIISNTVVSFLNDEINSEKKLSEIIPDSTQISIYEFVENSRGDICEKIVNALQKENVKEKVVTGIDEVVSSKLSPMIAMFVKGETIYPMIVNTLDEYFMEDENKLMIAGLINHEIKNFMNNTTGELVERYGEDRIKNIVNEGSNVLFKNFINNETIDKLFNSWMSSMDTDVSMREFLCNINENAMDEVEKQIENFIVKVLDSEKITEYIDIAVEKFLVFVENVQLGEILEKNEGLMESIESEVTNLFTNFMRNNSEKITKSIDIPAIVEEKINEFEMTEMEEIILEIANKELKAITWFGALLGFVLGAISIGISSL